MLLLVHSIEDDVHFYISQLRILIESTFGIFMRRWGLFWRPLECHFSQRAKLLLVAAKLHNFIIDNQGESRSQIRSEVAGS